MKRYFFILIAAAVTLQMVSCKDPVIEEAGTLTVTPETIAFSAEGGTEYIEVRTNAGSWSVEQPQGSEWCTPGMTYGSVSTTFALEAAPNTGQEERTLVLTFSAPGCSQVEVTVSQSGAVPEFEGDPVVADPAEWDGVKRADISYQR